MGIGKAWGFFAAGLFMLGLSLIFGLIAYFVKRNHKNKGLSLKGETFGKIEEVIQGQSQGLGGRKTDSFVVYSYEINQHKYIVKPCVIKKDCELNRKYCDSEYCSCSVYFGAHGGTRSTGYFKGESIKILYDISNHKKHIIANDKDIKNFIKGFNVIALIFIVLALLSAVIGAVLYFS